MLCQRASNSACVRSSRQTVPSLHPTTTAKLRLRGRSICQVGRTEDDDLLLSVACPVPTEQQPMNEVGASCCVASQLKLNWAQAVGCCVDLCSYTLLQLHMLLMEDECSLNEAATCLALAVHQRFGSWNNSSTHTTAVHVTIWQSNLKQHAATNAHPESVVQSIVRSIPLALNMHTAQPSTSVPALLMPDV